MDRLRLFPFRLTSGYNMFFVVSSDDVIIPIQNKDFNNDVNLILAKPPLNLNRPWISMVCR